MSSQEDEQALEQKEIQAELEAMKLPRGGIGFSLSRIQLIKILFTAGMLALVIMIQRPCSDAVSGFVTDMDNPAGSNARMPKPDNLDVPAKPAPKNPFPNTIDVREAITPNMSEAEVKAAIDRAWGKTSAPSWFDIPAVIQSAGSAASP